MKKLQWWFRIVGVFYLLLTLMNVYFLFIGGGSQMFADTLPAPTNTEPLAVRAFMDAWLVFVLEFGVLGAMALVASRAPLQNEIMVWVIIWAELFRVQARQKGNHLRMKRGNLSVTAPIHPGDLPPNVLRSIPRQAHMTPDAFLELL